MFWSKKIYINIHVTTADVNISPHNSNKTRSLKFPLTHFRPRLLFATYRHDYGTSCADVRTTYASIRAYCAAGWTVGRKNGIQLLRDETREWWNALVPGNVVWLVRHFDSIGSKNAALSGATTSRPDAWGPTVVLDRIDDHGYRGILRISDTAAAPRARTFEHGPLRPAPGAQLVGRVTVKTETNFPAMKRDKWDALGPENVVQLIRLFDSIRSKYAALSCNHNGTNGMTDDRGNPQISDTAVRTSLTSRAGCAVDRRALGVCLTYFKLFINVWTLKKYNFKELNKNVFNKLVKMLLDKKVAHEVESKTQICRKWATNNYIYSRLKFV